MMTTFPIVLNIISFCFYLNKEKMGTREGDVNLFSP
jgi:hypothetical protein